ncbi:MAG TPA: polysaccharide deacetylase family protein, partial [Chitinivibrionales bacterium]|nr:polysaccharide deacetylase family protein [Chitinivibrionales bacterium]
MTAAYIAIAFLVFPLCLGTAALLVFGTRPSRPGPVGLLLHTILEKPQPHCSFYSPVKFAALLRVLKHGNAAFATVVEAAGREWSDIDHPPTIVMTFDDGFDSFYTAALPLLQEYEYKVTVFPVAGYLGRPSAWDTLPPQTHLTREQLREIARMGHEIGSHTVTHANLTLLCDADLRDELSRSKNILEDITGKPITSLSFPFGQWNSRVWDAAREAGYTAATSYAHRTNGEPGIVPVWGIYSFDSVDDVIERAIRRARFSNAFARGCVMPHFAKGTPLWKFRKN